MSKQHLSQFELDRIIKSRSRTKEGIKFILATYMRLRGVSKEQSKGVIKKIMDVYIWYPFSAELAARLYSAVDKELGLVDPNSPVPLPADMTMRKIENGKSSISDN